MYLSGAFLWVKWWDNDLKIRFFIKHTTDAIRSQISGLISQTSWCRNIYWVYPGEYGVRVTILLNSCVLLKALFPSLLANGIFGLQHSNILEAGAGMTSHLHDNEVLTEEMTDGTPWPIQLLFFFFSTRYLNGKVYNKLQLRFRFLGVCWWLSLVIDFRKSSRENSALLHHWHWCRLVS